MPEERAGIARVVELAFGRPAEARLVAVLRKSAHFVPELSLVALRGTEIVGHILFTRVVVRGQEAEHPALALAPLAVRPGEQRRGVGTALVRWGIDEASRLGHSLVIVLGHADYYPRFGFVPASRHGIRAPFPVREEVFMVRELRPSALAGVAGEVVYPAAFSTV